jgi:hypothetical protein
MPRFLTALVAVCILVLGSTTASAQDQPMPGRGEILELERDDPRNTEGYRSFIFGSWTSGMGGLGEILDRVNADLEGDSRVTWEQLDAANPCIIIYRRDGHRFGHNGSCDTNSTAERVSYASYCEGDSSCARWPMANRVYRIPARPRLTPGERAEEMVRTLDETTVTETVPAPAELGGWLTELSDTMGEEQPPTYDQVRNVIAAVGRTLTRAEETASARTDAHAVPEPAATADTHADMTFTEESLPGTSEDEAALRPTSAEDGVPTSSTSDGAATSILMNPQLLWLIIAIMSVALILLLLKDKLQAWYRPTSLDAHQESPETGPVLPALTAEQEQDIRLATGLKRRWKQYFRDLKRNDQLTLESLFIFFDTADTNRGLVDVREKEIKQLQEKVDQLSLAQTALPIESPRVKELERELETNKRALQTAEQAKARAISDKETADAMVLELGMKHSKELQTKNEEIEKHKTLAKQAEDALEREQGKFEEYKAKGLALLEQFFQDGVANLGLALDHASRSGETSTPSFVTIIERISSARDLFKGMVSGVLNDLMIHFESDLAMVPAMAAEAPFAVAPAPLLPTFGGNTDSWEGSLDESGSDLATDPTQHGVRVPGFGGFTSVDEPASVPPSEPSMIPAAEALSLKGETTNPGIPAPAPSVTEEESVPDNVMVRMSQHAPPPPSAERPNGKKRRRDRKTTDSFERAPVAKAIEEQRNEKTAVIDPKELEHKKLEARTGKTISPGMTAAARDDSPIPGSLVPPPPPIVTLDASNGEEPEPTEAAPRPASLSIFDDLPGSGGETGVTLKRAANKD